MQLVGTRLDGNIHLGSGVHAVFCRVHGALNFKLLDGFDGWREAHCIDARFGRHHAIHCYVLLDVALTVRGDLDGLTGNRRATLPIDADSADAERNARHQRGELSEVPPVERQLDDPLRFDHLSQRCVLRLQQRRSPSDFDGFDLVANLHLEVEPRLFLQAQHHALANFSLKAFRFAGDAIFADVKQGEYVIAGLVGNGRPHVPRCESIDRNHCSRTTAPVASVTSPNISVETV